RIPPHALLGAWLSRMSHFILCRIYLPLYTPELSSILAQYHLYISTKSCPSHTTMTARTMFPISLPPQPHAGMLIQTTAFVVIWILLHRHVSHHGPIPGASSFCKLHNRTYSLASFLLLLLILSRDHDSVARRAYHHSK